MKILVKTCVLLFFVVCQKINAQNVNEEEKHIITGTIIDDETNEPVVGAAISYAAGKGVLTDTSGFFSLELTSGTYDLKMSFMGTNEFTKKVTVSGGNVAVGKIFMHVTNSLDEVEIASDVARVNKTPIAFSDIEAKQISRELGSNDMTLLLNSTPGAYASPQGGGAGDSRVNIRGFDQRYIGVLVDGVPVNDMENGRVFWSNWSGLAEITKKTQVQRGLGASRLALPAVGGIMNIITNSIDQEKSFVVRNDMGTNNYRRISIGYNSGLIKNRLGFTLAGSYTGGDGYIDQTWQKTWSYFAKVSYKLNRKNLLVFSVNGSPQSHGQRSFAINMAYHDRKFAEKQGINVDSLYALNKYTSSTIGARGTTYSPDWGYLNGEAQAVKINYFHKPLFNLSYFLNINSRASFSNVLYLSLGKGGGTSLNSFQGVNYDATGTGQLPIQTLYDQNVATPAGTVVPGESPAGYYMYSAVNNHKWVGTLATYKYKITSKLDFLGGLDARYYVGTHYQTPYSLLGGNYVIAPGGKDLNLAPYNKDPNSYIKREGDKISYYNDSKITWLGLFGQLEYKFNRLTTFITLTGNQSGFQYINYFGKKDIVISKDNIIHNAVGYGDTLYTDGQNYGVPKAGTPVKRNADGSVSFADNLSQNNVTIQKGYSTYNNSSSQARTNTSDIVYFKGYTTKAGLNYELNKNNNVFLNAGYMNLVPKFNNVFDNNGNRIANVKNQVILSAEVGYGLKFKKFAANLNAYLTRWGNKPADFITSAYDSVQKVTVNYNSTGIDALLKGIELDLSYQPVKYIDLKIFGMVADWKWDSKGTTYVYSDQGTSLATINFDAKGIPIGNAPQRQLGGSIKYELIKNIYVKVQYIYFDKMYAQFDPANLKVEGSGAAEKDYRGYRSWEVPGYGLFDLYAGYSIYSGKTKVDIMGTMNNVLDKVYMTDAFFPSGVKPDGYNALNTVGWMGLGRRVNIGIKVTL